MLYCQFDGGFIFSDADWQEVKLGRTFLKSDCQVTDNECRGNNIVKSEYAASLGHFTEFTSKYEVLIQEGRRADRSLVFITDGAIWMRNWMKENYSEATQILDFFHVCEHLGNFAKDVVSGLRQNYHLWYERQLALSVIQPGRIRIKKIELNFLYASFAYSSAGECLWLAGEIANVIQ